MDPPSLLPHTPVLNATRTLRGGYGPSLPPPHTPVLNGTRTLRGGYGPSLPPPTLRFLMPLGH